MKQRTKTIVIFGPTLLMRAAFGVLALLPVAVLAGEGTADPTIGPVTPAAVAAAPATAMSAAIPAVDVFTEAEGWVPVEGRVFSKMKVTKTPMDVRAAFGRDRRVIVEVFDNPHLAMVSRTEADGKVTKFANPHDLYPDHVKAEPGRREGEAPGQDKGKDDPKGVDWKPVKPKDGKPLPQGFTTRVYDAETMLILAETDDTTGLQTLYYYDEARMADIRALVTSVRERQKQVAPGGSAKQ